MNPLTYVIINLAILFLIQTGAVEVNAGRITQGAVVALYNYMRDGHIVEQGKHDDLLRKGGFYASIYNSQFAPC